MKRTACVHAAAERRVGVRREILLRLHHAAARARGHCSCWWMLSPLSGSFPTRPFMGGCVGN